MQARILALLLATLWSVATLAEPKSVPGELIVRFAPGVEYAAMEHAAKTSGALRMRKLIGPQIALVEAPAHAKSVVTVALAKHPLVISAEPNFMGRGGAVTPNDPQFPAQWHMNENYAANIGALDAWDITRGSSDVIIAILDSGLLLNQPEFSDRLLQRSTEYANFVDDDANGYVDDIQGWDFVDNDNDPTDAHGHGTWVTSTLGANANDAFGIAGVDTEATLMPLRILDRNNRGTTSALIEALYYAVNNGADVINLSLIEFPMTESLRNVLDDITGSTIVVACSGNGGPNTADDQFPGAHPGTLSVGATNSADELAYFSSTGRSVDLVAPGESITAADTAEPFEPDAADVVSGCSLATPIVSGVVGLMKSIDQSLDLADVHDILARTAVDLGPIGWDEEYGVGRINAAAALRETQARLSLESALFANGFE